MIRHVVPAIILGVFAIAAIQAQTAPGGKLFERLDKNADGRLASDEVTEAAAFKEADINADGFVTREELQALLARRAAAKKAPPKSPPPAAPSVEIPVLKDGLFERVHVPGFSDLRDGMNGVAVADMNGDGRKDIVASTTGRNSNRLRVYVNEGGMKFTEHAVDITGSNIRADDMGMKPEVPNLVDFNGDGFLDIFLTRHRGLVRNPSPGNTLLISDGAWDRFRDVSEAMGICNELGYNRQSSLGDVNGDGWLDIAIGCDTIGSPASLGYPLQKLYVFQPNGAKFEDGKFEDIGGTDLVPDFGGPYDPDPNKRRSGPGITLRDLDNDGDLDLVQSYHLDATSSHPGDPEGVHEQKFGVWCWKNLLRETGAFRFEKVTGNGMATEGQLRLTPDKKWGEVVAHSISLPYLSFADVDRDGLLDGLAVGPSSPGWHAESDAIASRFWKNLGAFRFEDRTGTSGLDAVGWSIGQWHEFWGLTTPPRMKLDRRGAVSPTTGMKLRSGADLSFYLADAIFADFDNDGWEDLVVCNRSERHGIEGLAANMLFMNNGDGTFRPTQIAFSGINTVSICGEPADLNGDGLLDLVFPADPGNSWGGAQTGDRPPESAFGSKIYLNTGLHGAKENHWLHLTFTGLRDAELIGARVELAAGGKKQYRWIHSSHSYKSGGALDAHFGLGKATCADVTVTLLGGKTHVFTGLPADQTHRVEIKDNEN
ncbi:MAG: FG-GAP-like repeat-containing protein [Planctomycetota bacterium]